MKILVIRFSALGDVAMTVPVLDSVARQYPQHEFTFLSKPFVAPLFAQMPSNVAFRGVDLKKYEGLQGLFRLFLELRKEKFDAVADLHDVLRTKVIRTYFRLSGVRVAFIRKGRKDKKKLVRAENKVLNQLPSSFERYEKVFQELGLSFISDFTSIYGTGKGNLQGLEAVIGNMEEKPCVGIAPFAAHQGKILPEKVMEELLSLLSQSGYKVLLFGGGPAEKAKLEHWAEGYPHVVSLAGKLKFAQELAVMSHLRAMVSMDSANMHLASLVNIPVVSVWGATHPLAGFMGWKQSLENAVQLDMPCRPCSIFGDKPCLRGDYACLRDIQAATILQKIKALR